MYYFVMKNILMTGFRNIFVILNKFINSTKYEKGASFAYSYVLSDAMVIVVM